MDQAPAPGVMSQELQQRMTRVHVQPRTKKENAWTAENVGTKKFKLWYTVNINV